MCSYWETSFEIDFSVEKEEDIIVPAFSTTRVWDWKSNQGNTILIAMIMGLGQVEIKKSTVGFFLLWDQKKEKCKNFAINIASTVVVKRTKTVFNYPKSLDSHRKQHT